MVGIWSRRGRIVLGIVGLVLVSAPVVGTQVFATLHERDQAARDMRSLASEIVGRAEVAIDSGLTALTDLSLLGVSTCSDRDLDLMRRAVYSNFWMKEVGVASGDGQILCNHIGDAIAIHNLSQPYPSRNKNVTLRLVEVGPSRSSGLMLVWTFTEWSGLSAIVPAEGLVSGVLPKYLTAVATGVLTLADGTLIAGFAPDPEAHPAPIGPGERVTARVQSDRYPIAMSLSAPLAAIAAQSGDLLNYARIGGAVVSALLFGLFIYLLKGPPVEIARLQDAVARGEFIPYYQPTIDIRTGRLIGCEVLMRWARPDGSIGAPDSFIHLAEASDLGSAMTLTLMRQVRVDLGPAFGERPELKIAINLFNAHFSSLRTVRDVELVFGGGPIAYSQLVFELTERQPLSDIERATTIIRRLQALGCRVALDDAGTGHSGLAYLHQLGVDVVKIDKLFVDTIDPKQTVTPIVASLIKLGHDLGMEVVAEGVETFEQLDYLRALGADSAQGYLFSPPLPVRAFVDLVEAMEPVASIGTAHGQRELVARVA